jgi:hypothetical protein
LLIGHEILDVAAIATLLDSEAHRAALLAG